MKVHPLELTTWNYVKVGEYWYVYGYFLEKMFMAKNKRKYRAKKKVNKEIRVYINEELDGIDPDIEYSEEDIRKAENSNDPNSLDNSNSTESKNTKDE